MTNKDEESGATVSTDAAVVLKGHGTCRRRRGSGHDRHQWYYCSAIRCLAPSLRRWWREEERRGSGEEMLQLHTSARIKKKKERKKERRKKDKRKKERINFLARPLPACDPPVLALPARPLRRAAGAHGHMSVCGHAAAGRPARQPP